MSSNITPATAEPVTLRPLVGDGTWGFLHAFIDGDDIVIRNGVATRWGGSDDDQDSGISASGLNTRLHPEYLGVSLPMNVPTSSQALKKAIGGSPIPKVPWYTPVKVYSHKTGLVVYGHVVDIGPARWTKHSLDCMNSLIHALGLPLADGVYDVDYRIIGAAKYVKG